MNNSCCSTVSIVDNDVLVVANCWLYFIIGNLVATISFECSVYFIFIPAFQEDKYDLFF